MSSTPKPHPHTPTESTKIYLINKLTKLTKNAFSQQKKSTYCITLGNLNANFEIFI